jgi:peptidylprolyl isomerase
VLSALALRVAVARAAAATYPDRAEPPGCAANGPRFLRRLNPTMDSIMRRRMPLILFALLVALAPRADAKQDTAANPTSTGKSATEAAPVDSKKPQSETGPTVTLDMEQGGKPMGKIVLRLYPDIAPKAVENFEGLVEKGYYDGIIFHRVIPDFMIQGGDPTGTGYGGKSLWGEPFADEFSPKARFDRAGLLAMANAGPKTNGSQLFITLKATPWLNDRHTIFGEVVEGMDVVQKIGTVDTNPANNKPVTDVVIKKATLMDKSKK